MSGNTVMCQCGDSVDLEQDFACSNCMAAICGACEEFDGLCVECREEAEAEEDEAEAEEQEAPVAPAPVAPSGTKTSWKLYANRDWLETLDELARLAGEPSRAALFERLVEEEGARRGVRVPARLEESECTPHCLRRALPGQRDLPLGGE